jgi:hypothetical protein
MTMCSACGGRLRGAHLPTRLFCSNACADREAGEVGIVYQSCGWLYLGEGVGRAGNGRWRFYNKRERRWYSEKQLTKRKIAMGNLRSNPDWIAEKQPAKARYVHFAGDRRERRALRAALRYPVLAYPKRSGPCSDRPSTPPALSIPEGQPPAS